MPRLKKEEVFPLIKGVLDGELCKSDFNELTNLKAGGYEYWLRKYRSSKQSNDSFVAVKTDRSPSMEGQLEVIFTHGLRIKFSKIVPASYLRELTGGQ